MYLHLPDLHSDWPLPKLANPNGGNVVGRESVQWIDSFHLFGTRQMEKFAKIKTGLLTAYAYPRHSFEHLRLSCDILNMLFASDEVSDLLDGVDAEKQVREIIDSSK